MLQALVASGPPGLKPTGHQQANGGNPNQHGGRKGHDGKGGNGGGAKGGVPLQFGTITPNFLGMTQQQQQPPRDPKAAGGKDGASPIAGKDGSPAQP